MSAPVPAADPSASEPSRLWRWAGPLGALLVFAGVVLVLHHQLAHLHVRSVVAHLHAIPRRQVLAALGFTAASYWLLSTYEVLALAYLRRTIPYTRILFTSFIAYSFGHTLGFAAFTGGAIRFRLYATAGITAIDVATISAFCSLSLGIGLATVSGVSLFLSPGHAASVLRLHHNWSILVGTLLLAAVVAYAAWACLARVNFEIRGWALRAPGARIGLAQIALSVLDLSLAAAVLWSLLPPTAHIGFIPFLGVYAAAVIAGIVSHVPGGVGVFEAVMLLTLPGVPTDALLGSLLAYRAVYYLVPLVCASLLFAWKELAAQRRALARAQELAALYVAPVVPQIAGSLTFLAGALLLFSGATPAVDERLAFLDQFLPLAVLEVSHLAGSIIGLGLLVLARALFRRVRAAYHICLWLLAAGIFASLLKGLDFEEASLLLLVLWVLMLGRRAFYRPTAILSERFTPAWVASIVGVIAMALWIGMVSSRHIAYSHELWWTFALDGNAPRALRASLAVIVLGTAYVLSTCCARRAPSPRWRTRRTWTGAPVDRRLGPDAGQRGAHRRQAPAVQRRRRCLRHVPGRAPQLDRARRSGGLAAGRRGAGVAAARDVRSSRRADGVLSGDRRAARAVRGPRPRGAEDRRGGAGAARRLLARGVGTCRPAAIVPARAARRRQLRGDSAAGRGRAAADAQRISDAWLTAKSTSEKRFSVGAFSPEYLRQFPLALVRARRRARGLCQSVDHGDARRAVGGSHALRAGCAARGHGLPVFELMLWARREGYRWFNLGMAPLAGLETHPLAPAWHRVGNFIFRHGEHFYNFEGLRRYKAKFDPNWEARYLAARGGIALPRVLIDVSVLIAGGMKELFAR